MAHSAWLVGERRPRARVALAAVLLPVVASVAFLLEYDAVLDFSLLYLSAGIALYAGWSRAGLIAGSGAVFLAIRWRFVVPPAVGDLRWSMDTRYTPPRFLGYKLEPRGELLDGLTHGPAVALGGAIVLGGGAYAAGAVLRRLAGPDDES